MAWCLLPVVLLLISTSAGEHLNPCETKEATGSYIPLYHSHSTSGFPCECNIRSEHTLTFVFKTNAGVDNSNKSGGVTLRSMNGDKDFEVPLMDREEMNGSHFLLIFQNASLKEETNIRANGNFTLKCLSKIHGGSNKTNSVSIKNQNKDEKKDVVIVVTCAVAGTSVLFVITVVWCVRRTRKQRLPVTDKRQDNLYDTADRLLEPRAASPPMTSLMTYSSCGQSATHSANTAFHTNTTLRTNITGRLSPSTAFRTVSEAGYDTPGDTVRQLNSLKHTEDDTYRTLKRDCPRREVGTTETAVYDQCQPPADTDQGSGDNGRPLEDNYCRLQRCQERQPVIGNIYDSTSAAVSVAYWT